MPNEINEAFVRDICLKTEELGLVVRGFNVPANSLDAYTISRLVKVQRKLQKAEEELFNLVVYLEQH